MNAEEYVIERVKKLEQENAELNKQITDLNWCISRREKVASDLVESINLRVNYTEDTKKEGYITCDSQWQNLTPNKFKQASELIGEIKKWKKS